MGRMSSMTGQTPGAMGEAEGSMRNAERARVAEGVTVAEVARGVA